MEMRSLESQRCLPSQSCVAHMKMSVGAVQKAFQDFCSTITSQEFPSCHQSIGYLAPAGLGKGWEENPPTFHPNEK